MVDAIEIRALAAEDAANLTACFERCYGDSYAQRFFYDPAAIRARLHDGRLRSVVAVTPSGEIVGHMALSSRHQEACTVEAGNTIVDPRYRGQRLAARLGVALAEACRQAGYVGFHHYPTTAHPIMQELAVEGGGTETGVMLAYVPETTDYRGLGGQSAQGRLAAVSVYQPLAAAPVREVFLPPRFAPMLRAIYARAALARTEHTPADSFACARTRLGSRLDGARGLLHIEVNDLGTDVGDRLSEATGDRSAAVTHVDLSLSDPATPLAVEALRPHDFFFCALLPEFAASDVLRLQRLADRTEPRILPALVHPEARDILRTALSDRDIARREAGGASS